ncbi:Cyclin-like F-box [Akanthomyces lecanii RCEF 1005]|uniref:Cyclin-like F-box n=1 Tax=Akanthomyces lecanii RCEF 1005 TaxID=1081108 RepID=A0A167XL78_CORDF|nr:Cyclin-like F-box [Akanthomyces lecanii RCEF 1005]
MSWQTFSSSNAASLGLRNFPRWPEKPFLAHSSFLKNASSDDVTIRPRKLIHLDTLTNILSELGRRVRFANSSGTALAKQCQSDFLDRLLALPPELLLKVLLYLDFGDLERLRRTCRFFHTQVSPGLVRSLLAPDFGDHVRRTCRICLRENSCSGAVVGTDRFHPRYPLSSRCQDCVWKDNGFMVGKKYLMGNSVAAYVCRWCGRPINSRSAWYQPEYHKGCLNRLTRVLCFYFYVGCAQWACVFVASALCWHYFQPRKTWIVGVVVAGFLAGLLNFYISLIRGNHVRNYHFALFLEVAVLSLWFPPLLGLFGFFGLDSLRNQPGPSHSLKSYETATVVFIILNMVFRSINMVGNAILLCEFKLWRHKKPDMSPARGAWIRTIQLFLFVVEPQCVEQEYPPRYWPSRRSNSMQTIDIVGVTPNHPPPGIFG